MEQSGEVFGVFDAIAESGSEHDSDDDSNMLDDSDEEFGVQDGYRGLREVSRGRAVRDLEIEEEEDDEGVAYYSDEFEE